MAFTFKELDFQSTPLGDISLRKRAEPKLDGKIVFEVKLNDDFLMSSLFPEAEIALAELALSKLEGDQLEVIVGGLGLGYTAAAALKDSRVTQLTVIEVMQAVIDWHQQHLVPLGEQLSNDKRCELRLADFFALATQKQGFHASQPNRLVDAILLDIDHSPSHWLNSENKSFYSKQNLTLMAQNIKPNGCFGLWSNDPPEPQFEALLRTIFRNVESHVISFTNPFRDAPSTNTVYLGLV